MSNKFENIVTCTLKGPEKLCDSLSKSCDWLFFENVQPF